MREELV